MKKKKTNKTGRRSRWKRWNSRTSFLPFSPTFWPDWLVLFQQKWVFNVFRYDTTSHSQSAGWRPLWNRHHLILKLDHIHRICYPEEGWNLLFYFPGQSGRVGPGFDPLPQLTVRRRTSRHRQNVNCSFASSLPFTSHARTLITGRRAISDWQHPRSVSTRRWLPARSGGCGWRGLRRPPTPSNEKSRRSAVLVGLCDDDDCATAIPDTCATLFIPGSSHFSQLKFHPPIIRWERMSGKIPLISYKFRIYFRKCGRAWWSR